MRDKVIIGLVVFTLLLGLGIMVSLWNNEVEANYVRWYFFTNVPRMIASPSTLLGGGEGDGSQTTFYAALSIMAVGVMSFFFVKFARGGSTADAKRLADLESEKNEAERLLQEAVWKEKTARQAREAAVTELEEVSGRLIEIQDELTVKERELKALRSSAGKTGQSSSVPESELKRNLAALQEKEAADREVQKSLSGKVRILENQLNDKNNQLKTREGEISELQAALAEFNKQQSKESARREAANGLQNEIERLKGALDEKDIEFAALEKGKAEESRRLQGEIKQGQSLLKQYESELKSLQVRVDALGQERSDAEGALRKELQSAHVALQEKEAAFKEAGQHFERERERLKKEFADSRASLGAKQAADSHLADQLSAAQDQLKQANATNTKAQRQHQQEVDALKKELAALRHDAGSHERELERYPKEIESLQARVKAAEAAKNETEKRFRRDIDQLTKELAELQKATDSKGRELSRSQIELKSFQEQFEASAAAKNDVERQLQEAIKTHTAALQGRDKTIKDLEKQLLETVDAKSGQLSQVSSLLQSRDRELEELRGEIKSLREHSEARERSKMLLQEELKKRTEALKVAETQVRQFQGEIDAKSGVLAQEVTKTAKAIENTDKLRSEVATLTSELAATKASKEDVEKALRAELTKQQRQGENQETALGELKKKHDEQIKQLEQGRAATQKLEGEIESLKAQLTESKRVGGDKEKSWRDELTRQAQRAADLEAKLKQLDEQARSTIRKFESDNKAKDTQVAEGNAELEALRAEIKNLNDLATARDRAKNLLQQEFKKRTDELHEREQELKAVEQQSNEKIAVLQKQIEERGALVSAREAELQLIKGQLQSSEQLKAEVEQSLQREIEKEREQAQSKDSGLKELERSFAAKYQALEKQVNEKQALVDARNKELGVLKGEVEKLAGQLREAGATSEKNEKQLQASLKKERQAIVAKEAALKDLENKLRQETDELHTKVASFSDMVSTREKQIEALNAQLARGAADGDDRLVRMEVELNKSAEALNEKDQTIKELEEEMERTFQALESHRLEQETLVRERDRDIETLRHSVSKLQHELNSRDGRQDTTLPVAKSAKKGAKEFVADVARMEELEELLQEKDKMLQSRDSQIEKLSSELTEKRTQLAKQEIEVWQGIERRAKWKGRLSKLGINIKD